MEIYTANTKNEINVTKKTIGIQFPCNQFHQSHFWIVVKKIQVRISKRIARLDSFQNYFISQNMNWQVMGKGIIV